MDARLKLAGRLPSADGGSVLGLPAAPDKQAKRQIIAVQQLPDMLHRLRELEKQVEELRAKVGAG